MPQFPTWKPPVGAVVDAVQARGSQVRDAAADVVDHGRQTRDDVTAKIVDVANTARTHGEQLPRSLYDEFRRRMNWLDLATKQDVETQTRLGRRRLTLALNEFLAAQREHEKELLDRFRTEIRAELEGLASALNDDAFEEATFDDDEYDDDDLYDDELDLAALVGDDRPPSRHQRNDLDYDLDDEDDEIDLTADEIAFRHSVLEANEW
jgi:hypothetical protein